MPERVEVVSDSSARLQRLAAADFDPQRVAFVEEPLDLPTPCAGEAEIVSESPDDVTLRFDMQTAGCLVLADLWYPGWHAFVGDRELPILRVNHALRGVLLPAGSGEIQMRFKPASFALGLKLAIGAAVGLGVWGFLVAIAKRQKTPA